MFVQSGILSRYKTCSTGKRQIVALCYPGEGILSEGRTAHCGLEAINRSEVVIAPARQFYAIVGASKELQLSVSRESDRHISIVYEWLFNCGRRSKLARVAHLLCELAERGRHDFNQESLVNPFTQQQVADITGQTSVNVNRVFAKLEVLGLIRRKGRQLQVRDWRALRETAGFDRHYLA